MHRDVIDYFEEIAVDFDSYYERPKGFLSNVINIWLRKPGLIRRLNITLKECNPKKGMKILDIGCGSGKFVVECAKKKAEVIGIDTSKEMIEIAKKFCKKNNVEADLRVGDATKQLPKDNDVCVALGVIEYFKNPKSLLKNMIESTNENGKIIFSVPSLFSFQTPLRKILLGYKKIKCYYYTKKRVLTLINSFKNDIKHISLHSYGPGLVVCLERGKSIEDT
jgi:2-polyprenyl-3-methyl-5-hydroxy-6-metoxy-1,4-benzoquinol methylase